jgi:hypothetical protein
VVFLGTEAEVLFVVEEVGGCEALERHSQGEQGVERGASIVFRWPNEDVEVISSADIAVRVDRNSADNGVFNLGGGERGEE